MISFIDFNSDAIKLEKVYESQEFVEQCTGESSDCSKTKKVYGKLQFPKASDEFPYLYGSFVTSVDGKIAYNEDPDGTLIARTNKMDTGGGFCDYWILNLLRSVSHGSIVGAGTIAKEPELTSCVYDKDLYDERVKRGLAPIPTHIITSKDGSDVPIDHIIFNSEIPFIVSTSPAALDNLDKEFVEKCVVIDKNTELTELRQNAILITGEGNLPDIREAMRVLRKIGLEMIICESPTYLALLMKAKLLNEAFLNQSGIFIGGDCLTIARYVDSFTIEEHPHMRTVSIHNHSDYFFYTRYKVIY